MWERNNAFLGSRYILKDKLISWQGRKARLEMAINMEEWETLDHQRQAYLMEKGEFGRSGYCRSCLFDSQYAEILDNTNLGLWEIRLDPETGKSEMYADPVMRRIMGITEDITPEECYTHWYSRINAGYYHYIKYGGRKLYQHREDYPGGVYLEPPGEGGGDSPLYDGPGCRQGGKDLPGGLSQDHQRAGAARLSA